MSWRLITNRSKSISEPLCGFQQISTTPKKGWVKTTPLKGYVYTPAPWFSFTQSRQLSLKTKCHLSTHHVQYPLIKLPRCVNNSTTYSNGPPSKKKAAWHQWQSSSLAPVRWNAWHESWSSVRTKLCRHLRRHLRELYSPLRTTGPVLNKNGWGFVDL